MGAFPEWVSVGGGLGAVWDLGRFSSLGLGVSGSFGAFFGSNFSYAICCWEYLLSFVGCYALQLRFSLQWPAFYFPCISYCYYY